jgi:hypothetical protein
MLSRSAPVAALVTREASVKALAFVVLLGISVGL